MRWGRILSRLGPEGFDNQRLAIRSIEKAIELDPNYADAYAFVSLLYIGIGEDVKSIDTMNMAMRLNPKYPFWYAQNRAIIHYMKGDFAAAIADLEKAAAQNPTAVFVRWWLAAAYALAGRQEDAEWQVEEMRALGFKPRTSRLVTSMAIIHHPPFRTRMRDGLLKAGIPE